MEKANTNEKITALKEKLVAGIDAIRTSDDWFNMLNFWKGVWHYSRVNRILIMLQTNGKATCVRSYKAWQKLGYNVKRGEKGITIWVPRFKKEKDENGKEIGEKVYFWTGTVFDVSQTTAEKCPELVTKTNQECQEAKDLVKQIKELSFVSEKDAERRSDGYYNQETGNIYLALEDKANDLVNVFFHEFAHKMVHEQQEKKYSHTIEEILVESVAYILCNLAGVETGNCNSAYIASYLGENNSTKVIELLLDDIAKTANTAVKELKKLGIDIEPAKDTEPAE